MLSFNLIDFVHKGEFQKDIMLLFPPAIPPPALLELRRSDSWRLGLGEPLSYNSHLSFQALFLYESFYPPLHSLTFIAVVNL